MKVLDRGVLKLFLTLRNMKHIDIKGSPPNFTSNVNPLSANPTKWSNTLNQFRRQQPTNCFSVLNHLLGLAVDA